MFVCYFHYPGDGPANAGRGGRDHAPQSVPSGEDAAAPEAAPDASPEEDPDDPDALIFAEAEAPTEAEIDFDAEEPDATDGDADVDAEDAAEAEGAEAGAEIMEEMEEQAEEEAACDAAAMDGAHTHGGITFTAWTSRGSLPDTIALNGGTGSWYLTDDVNLDGPWIVPQGTVNLCLNGYGIILSGSAGSVIEINNGATLNLFDEGVRTHKYSITNGLAVVGDSGDRSFNGGYITGGKSSGLTVVNGGAFNMYGGTIIGNTAIGGGVDVRNAGTFDMSGGSITGNTASHGGGGVYVLGEFTMSGGSVTDNTATYDGGGVYVDTNGTFNISGKPEIKENKKNNDPNAVYLPDGKKITVTGALTSGARISVTMHTPGTFTTGYGANNKDGQGKVIDPWTYIFSNASSLTPSSRAP